MICLNKAKAICNESVLKKGDFSRVKIVYGSAGTYLFEITIAINEAFTPLSAIVKLRSLNLSTCKVGLYFNLTIFSPKDVSC